MAAKVSSIFLGFFLASTASAKVTLLLLIRCWARPWLSKTTQTHEAIEINHLHFLLGTELRSRSSTFPGGRVENPLS